MTRQDYLDGFVTHEDYYARIAESSGIQVSPSITYLDRFTLAEHHRPAITNALAQHGDTWNFATGVCTVVAAANLAKRNEE